MIALSFKTQLLAATVLLLASGPTLAGARVVDCDAGDSLQNAIDAGVGSAAPVEINVTGYCTENLLITRDRVSIYGDGNTAIDGRVSVRGANNLMIQNLTITGSGDGISASVARIRLINVHLVGNYGDGIALRHGGYVFMRDGSIANNHGDIGLLIENGSGQLRDVEVSDNDFHGIVVNVNGSLEMIGGSVNLHEQAAGITAKLSSTIELDGVTVNNNLDGIYVSTGSAATIYNSTVNENYIIGIAAIDNSSAEIGGSELAHNELYGAQASSHSVLRFYDAWIHDNHAHGVVVESDGGLFIEGTTNVDGNWADYQIECRGKEASMEIGDNAYVGSWDCEDVDF
jgi:hypothetical protein